ncbi:alanine/ornithine racemase family PLP-dependent enzyme [Sinomicrobium pectinilyticum]|uniref:Alanine/ornithine racemase family PLP-dependent enzyme n=1 Tax=Sinomicrobium pectinilyticum TaxID=1084421 RepID=A0A3N0EYW5_SINP1|nr:alanine racemase [Sinomicrobium pectinilyticum]RNL93025.1 alanine/ornithine racemase family PLP-dependent enzyme [Sinomicrobium pectinilyticum]
MAYLKLNTRALKHNYLFLKNLFGSHKKDWGVVTKLLCGNKLFLKEVIGLHPDCIFDSRLSNLAMVKKISLEIKTGYIKPPPTRSIEELIEVADISFNTQFETIEMINRYAEKAGKVHQIVIMIEMGDLREGVMRENFVDFYARVFELKAVEVMGIGANLNCLNGIMPSHDKLIQLSLYEQIIEAKFNKKIPWVSLGTSVTLPLLLKNLVPEGVNHFRIGETLFFGNDLFEDSPMEGMKQDVFMLYAEVLEVMEKPINPTGYVGSNVAGEIPIFEIEDYSETSIRILVDIGILDIEIKNIKPLYEEYRLEGGSSDMIVLDVGKNNHNIRVGDMIPFHINYMGALRLLNSKYIEKRLG